MTQTTEKHEYLTLDEAAALLRVTPGTIRARIRAGQLTGYRITGGKNLLFKRADVIGLLEPVTGDGEDAEVSADVDPADLDPQERAETIAGVKRGIEAMRQGRMRSFAEFAAEQRAKYGIPE